MSELGTPAIAVWEFASIAEGIHGADAIAKGAPVTALLTGTTHPGKYLVLASGDTASVDVAIDIVEALDAVPTDMRFLPDVASEVVDAVTAADGGIPAAGEAVGIVETATVSSTIDAADAAVKAAPVALAAVRLADGLGGKAYLVVDGSVGAVDAAVEAAVDRAGAALVASVVIPQLTDDLRQDLASSAHFLDRLRSHAR